MEETTMNDGIEINEESHSKKSKSPKEKKVAAKSDAGGLKIALPPEMANRLQEAYATLRDRGYDGKIEDVLASLWDQATDEWCEARVESLTPDEYYLEATKQLPEIRQKLVDQAKKALLKAKEGHC